MTTRRRSLLLLTTDVGLSVFLVMIVVFIFVLPPLGRVGIIGRSFVIDIFFSLLLISGIASVSERKGVFAAVTGITVIALVFRWTDSFIPLPALQVLDYVATIVSVLLFLHDDPRPGLQKGPYNVPPHRRGDSRLSPSRPRMGIRLPAPCIS